MRTFVLPVALAFGCGAAAPEPMQQSADSKLVQLDVTLGNTFVPAEIDSEVLARIRISSKNSEANRRPVVNLVLAIDTSASMTGEAIENAKGAASVAVKSLVDGDRLAIVVFHSSAEVFLPSTEITSASRKVALERIAEMKATGTTDLAGGLGYALQEMQRGRKAKTLNRIVLLSDGVPNHERSIDALATNTRSQGGTITALGLGLDYDETLLGRLARASGGYFHFIEDPKEVATVFRDELLRINDVVARNMQLRLTFGPGMTIKQLPGHEAQVSGNTVSLAVGEMGLGEKRDFFVVLDARGRSENATVEVLDAVLSFQDVVAGGAGVERRAFAAAKATANADSLSQGFSSTVELEVARAAAAAATLEAIAMARANRLDEARVVLETAEKTARAMAAKHDQDEELIELANSMESTREALPSFVQTVAPTKRPAPGDFDDAGGAPSIPSMPATESSSRVRRSHDRASRTLQGR